MPWHCQSSDSEEEGKKKKKKLMFSFVFVLVNCSISNLRIESKLFSLAAISEFVGSY